MRIFILAYHRVYPGHRIDPDTLDYHLGVMKKNFVPLTLDEAVDAIAGKKEMEKNGFAVTFDDGWADLLPYAYPVLQKHGVPATVFVSTNCISNTEVTRKINFVGRSVSEAVTELAMNGHSDEFLTWGELQRMQPLVRIESHGHTHAYHFRSPKITGIAKPTPGERETYLLLSGTNPKPGQPLYASGSVLAYPRYFERERKYESADAFTQRVTEELTTSVNIIAAKTGRRPKYLAWPFGEYSPASVAIAKKVGMRACFSISQGYAKRNNNLCAIKRFSPPRSRRWFLTALKGRMGMVAYRGGLAIASLTKGKQKNSNCPR